MDLANFLRLVRETQDAPRPRSSDQNRVLNTVNLGPGVQWVFDDAAHNFTQFVPAQEASNSADAEKEMGNKAYSEGKYEEAVQHYTAAINKEKDNAVYYSNRAAAYMALEKWDLALQDANKTIALRPEWSRGYARKGAVMFKQGKYMQAAAAYAEALALDPDNAEVKKGLAKSEAAYRRELLVEHAMVDVGVQTTEVDEANLGAIIKANISMGEGAELLQNVIQLRQEHFFYDPSADQVVNALKDDMMVSSEFNKQLRRNQDVIQYADFCKLQQQFYEQQDRLRECALGEDKEKYASALKTRDEAENKLMTAATASLDAYSRLAELEKKRAEYISDACKQTSKCMAALKSYCEEVIPAIPDAERALIEKGDGLDNKREGDEHTALTAKRRRPSSPVSAGGQPEKRFDTVKAKLMEYQEWKKKLMGEVGVAVAATNAAANQFYHALRQEEAAVTRNLSLLHKGPILMRELAALAECTVEALEAEDVSVSLQHIRSQQADFESAYTNLLNINECRKQAAGLLQEEAELEKERLALEKRRIKVQAEADWLKVKGEEGLSLDKATQMVQEYKERIRRVVSRQAEVEQHLSDLAQSHQPELLWNAVAGENSIKNRHMKWVKGCGVWMNRSLVDFDIKRLLGTSRYSKVFLASYHGHECVLKEIPIESDTSRKAFLNEVTIVTELRHPYIVHINGVFQDGPMAYIVMPYYPNGTIRNYLEHNKVTPWALQEMLRQVCSGVAHLHEHKVVHRDLKPSNVLMQGNQPLIADFGIAKDLSSELDSTTIFSDGIKGTASYLAPEVLGGGPHSFASDIWALGVLLYEAAALVQPKEDKEGISVNLPVLLPGKDQITVSSEEVGSLRLADLITSILQRDPNSRPSAHAILAHPYFAVSLLQDMSENHTLMESDQKLAALASFLQQLRATPRRVLPVVLDRKDIINGMARLMEQLTPSDFLRPLFVAFRNEQAVDEGGVLAEMYTLYFTKCVARDTQLFVCAEDGEGTGHSSSSSPRESAPNQDDISVGAFYLPNPRKTSPADIKAFQVFGKVLLRSLLDNAPCPFQPSLALFKYLAGVSVSLVDLEQYDRVFAHQLRDLLLTKDDVADLCLDFSGLQEHGEEVAVTNENKEEYVKRKVQYTLIDQRRAQLEAIKEGFTSHASLTPHLQLLSPSELMIAMCGAQHIKAEALAKQLAFRGWPVASQTPKMLIDLIHGMSQNNLRRFLRLTTASCVLPSRGLRRHISVVCLPNSELLPVGHTCSFQLDLPDYNDAEKLKSKMAMALPRTIPAYIHLYDAYLHSCIMVNFI